MKKKAFTLAEVLITLGIIGVVAALTIPTLVQRNTNEGNVVTLKKIYGTLDSAFEQFEVENNVAYPGEGGLLTPANCDEFIKEFFKVSVDCGTQKGKPCFADTYKNINGTTVGVNSILDSSGYSVMLSDGTAISIGGWDPYYITVDTNGPKGPNIIGRDLFSIFWDGMPLDPAYYYGSATPDRNLVLNQCKSNTSQAYGCLKLIQLDGWKMDY